MPSSTTLAAHVKTNGSAGQCSGSPPSLRARFPAEERHRLLVEWNQTATNYPLDKCVHELFEAQVQRTPEAGAVVCSTEELTYRELDDRPNHLAQRLIQQGVGPETLVGLCVERTAEMVVGLLGILKAGGAYVPLEPSLPPE